MTRRLSYVAEITVVVDASGTTQTFYFGTEGFSTGSADTPADTVIRGLLKDPGSYRQELFSGARVTGASRPSFGVLTLSNADGVLDDWLDYGVSAGQVTVRLGDIDDAYPAGWSTVYVAYAYAIVADFSEVRIQLRDRSYLLDKPIVSAVFGEVPGIDGSATARKKQMVFGRPGFIPPILLNGIKGIYYVQANASRARALINPTSPEYHVFDGGVPLTFGGYYATAEEAIELDNAPGEGEFKVYADGVDSVFESTGPLYVRLGSPPESDVRYNPNGMLKNNADETARTWTFVDLVNRAGLMDVTQDTMASGSFLRTVGNYLCDSDQTYIDVMDDMALATFCPYGFDRLDRFFTYNLRLGGEGSDSSVHTFTVHNCKDIRRLPVPGMETPVWQVHVQAGKCWPGQVLNSVSAANREVFTRDVTAVFTATAQVVKTANPGAETATVEIVGNEFSTLNARMGFALRYFTLYGARRDLFMVTAPLDTDTLGIDLHDKVTITMPRLGCDSGRLFRVVTVEHNLQSRLVTFGLWGGDPGPGNATVEGGSGSYDPDGEVVIGDPDGGGAGPGSPGGSGTGGQNPDWYQMGKFIIKMTGTVDGAVGNNSALYYQMGNFTMQMTGELSPGGVLPTYRNRRTGFGSGGFTVAWPTAANGNTGLDYAVGDLGVLVVASDGNTTMSTPSGWTVMPGAPVQDVLSSDGVTLSVFYRRAESTSEADVTVPDMGVIQSGAIFTVRGVIGTGAPCNAYASGSTATPTTTHVWPSVTTSISNTLIVCIGANPYDSAAEKYSAQASTSGDVTALTERFEYGSTFGTGHSFVVFTGEFAVTGATDTLTATCDVSTTYATLTLALYGV